MSTHKYIYWRDDLKVNDNGKIPCNVHLLVGYNQACITDFIEMADKLRVTFPEADNKDIGCGKVFKSSSCYGFSIITWFTYLDKKEYEGWHSVEGGRMEYYW